MRSIPQPVADATGAEIRLLRAQSSRLARRIIVACVGLVFAFFAMASLHVAAFLWVIRSGTIGPIWAAIIVLASDLVIVVVAGLLVAGNVPSAAQRRAVEDRRRALTALGRPVSSLARAVAQSRTSVADFVGRGLRLAVARAMPGDDGGESR